MVARFQLPLDLPAKRRQLLERGAKKRTSDEANRRATAECAGDGIKCSWRKALSFGDCVDRFPALGIELRLECVEAAKVVEPRAV